MSGEHIWPAWAAGILPRSVGRDFVTLKRVWGRSPVVESIKYKQGAIVDATVQAVCTGCNNGWMNRLEEAARPILEMMIQGHKVRLDPSATVPLTRWVALKAMIIDRHRSFDHVFTATERKAFYEAHCDTAAVEGGLVGIPHRLEVALFRCGEGRWTNAIGIDRATISNVAGYKPPRTNVALFVWGLGELLISMIYRDGVRFPLPVTDDSEIELWPLVTSPTWPRARRLTEVEATQLEDALSLMTRNPKAKDWSGREMHFGDLSGPAQWLRHR